MSQRTVTSLAFVIIAALAVSPAAAKRHYVEGEVIQIQLQQETQTRNRNELNHLTIRTREGQELRLRLGSGPCDGCPQLGDRVRARLMRQLGPDERECDVRALRNLTTRERLRFRDGSGNMITIRERTRLGDRSRSGRREGAGRRGGDGGRRGGGG